MAQTSKKSFPPEIANSQIHLEMEIKMLSGIPLKKLKYYLAVTVEGKTIAADPAQSKDGVISWNKKLFFDAKETSAVKIEAYEFHTIRRDKCVASFQELVADLLKSMNGIQETGKQDITRTFPSSSLQITFSMFSKSDTRQEKLDSAIQDVNAAAGNITSHTAQVITDAISSTTADVKNAEGFLNQYSDLLDKVGHFVKLVENVSEVHPYAKMAVSVLTSVYNVMNAQRVRDDNIMNLIKIMNETYDFVNEAEPIKAIKKQKLALERLAQQTLECAYFISTYSKDSSFIFKAGKHLVSGVDDAIKDYKSKFEAFRKAFDSQAIMYTEITVLNIARDTADISLNVDLNDMTYAAGARFQSSKQCLEGTRVEILDDISNWINNTDDHRQVCVLAGEAGTGKSAIANTIAGRFYKMGRLGSSFCFERGNLARRPATVLPTVMRDIAGRDQVVKVALGEVIRDNPSLRKTEDLQDQFEELVLKPITQLSITGPVVVVIDALDECGDVRSRRTFFQLVAKEFAKLPQNFKVFITSRPEEDVLQYFAKQDHILFLAMPSIYNNPTTKRDIIAYIDNQLYDLEGIGSLERHELVERSEGLFQWSFVACDTIKGDGTGGTTEAQRYRQLLDSLASGVPPLDSLYIGVLTQIFGSGGELVLKKFQSVLGFILMAFEPLTAINVRNLRDRYMHRCFPSITYDGAADISVIIKYMGSLLSGVTSQDTAIRPLHTSFRDFILDPKRSGKYWVDIHAAHEMIAVSCLESMNMELRFNMCRLDTSYLANKDIPDLQVRLGINISPELSYACKYWGTHLQIGGAKTQSSILFEQLATFFHEKLLFWFEALSLLSSISIAYGQLSFVIALASEEGELTAIAQDAQYFVRENASLMAESAPHVYLSALSFCPSASLVSKQFSRMFRKICQVPTGRPETWPAMQMIIRGHKDCVNSVAFSADGKRIASGSSDCSIRVWDVEVGAVILGPLVHENAVCSVSFSHNKMQIASGSDDGSICIWDTDTGVMILGPLKGHNGRVNSVAFSPDGKKLVSGSSDSTIRVWDTKTGYMILGPLEGHKNQVNSVAFSFNGKKIASGSDDGTIRVWDADKGTLAFDELKGHSSYVRSVSFSECGKIASGSADRTIRVWDSETGIMVVGPLEGHEEDVTSIAFSRDRKRMVSGSTDTTIRVWDSETGALIFGPLQGHSDWVNSVAFSSDGKRIVSASNDYTIRIWDGEFGPTNSDTIFKWVTSVAFSSNGKIASGSYDNAVRVWDSRSGELVLGPLKAHADMVTSVAFSADGKKIASGSTDCVINIWDAVTGVVVLGPLKAQEKPVNSVAFSPDDRKLVSGSSDCTIRVWDLETGAVILCPLEGHTKAVFSVAFSALIASGSEDRTIRLWDAATGSAIGHPLEGHDDWVRTVALSKNGKRIASGSDDETIRVWDAETGAAILEPIKAHDGSVLCVEFSYDDKYIASCSTDSAIKIWDAAKGTIVLGPFEAHNRLINSLSFSKAGKPQLASGCGDHTIRVWNVEIEAKDAMKESIAFSSHSKEHALSVKELMLQSPSTNPMDAIRFDKLSGWILGPREELILWVPVHHRAGLWLPRNTGIMDIDRTELDLSQFAHGVAWTKCYEG